VSTPRQYTHIFAHFKSVDPVIYQALLAVDLDKWFNKVKKRASSTDYFVALCRAIVGQQLSGKAADAIYNKFTSFFGDNYAASQILQATDQSIRDIGLSWAKVKYVKDLACKFEEREIDFAALDSLADDTVVAALTKVKGVGPWTAEMFLMFTLRRENVFSFGDLGLRKGIIKLYAVADPSLKQIEKIVAPWQPYRTFGSIALWQSLEK